MIESKRGRQGLRTEYCHACGIVLRARFARGLGDINDGCRVTARITAGIAGGPQSGKGGGMLIAPTKLCARTKSA